MLFLRAVFKLRVNCTKKMSEVGVLRLLTYLSMLLAAPWVRRSSWPKQNWTIRTLKTTETTFRRPKMANEALIYLLAGLTATRTLIHPVMKTPNRGNLYFETPQLPVKQEAPQNLVVLIFICSPIERTSYQHYTIVLVWSHSKWFQHMLQMVIQWIFESRVISALSPFRLPTSPY